jgi:lysophospholipase L1-like esterase
MLRPPDGSHHSVLYARGLRGLLARAVLGLGVALALIALGEGTLRLVFGPPPPPLMVRTLWDFSLPLLELHGDVVLPVFQREDAIPPFPVQKRTGRPRILCVGGSTVRAGSRLPVAEEFPGILERLLGDRGLEAEVLNLGRPVFDSGGIREVVAQAMVLRPDVVVSFQGHNDIGNLTFLHLYGDLRSAFAARLRVGFSQLRLFTLLERVVDRAARRVAPPHGRGPPPVQRVERARVLVAEDFYRRNLDQMTRNAQAKGVVMVLATIVGDDLAPPGVPTCPDRIPPGSGVLEGRAWHLGIPVPALTLGNVEEGLESVPDCADLQYLKGLLLGAANPQGAEAFQRARDLDPLPIRATTRIGEATRQVARDRGAVLVDVDAIARRQGGGVPPRAWFLDSVHLSREGHLAVAQALAGPVEEALYPIRRNTPR